jgi:hypothetical protein
MVNGIETDAVLHRRWIGSRRYLDNLPSNGMGEQPKRGAARSAPSGVAGIGGRRGPRGDDCGHALVMIGPPSSGLSRRRVAVVAFLNHLKRQGGAKRETLSSHAVVLEYWAIRIGHVLRSLTPGWRNTCAARPTAHD